MSDGSCDASPPSRGSFTGKLPKEFVDQIVKSQEEFLKLLKESEEFNLQVPYLIEMGWDEPFFGSLSRRLYKLRTTSIPTAGVSYVPSTTGPGLLELLYNPIFFHKIAKEKKDFVRGVLKHELYHIIFEHITSRRQTPHTLWNVAADLAINSLIPRDELPGFVLVPGELQKSSNGSPPSLIAQKIAAMPKERHAEYYMAELMADPDVQRAMQRARGAASARGQGQPCESGGQGGEGDGSPGDGSGSGRAFEEELRKELFGDGGGQFDDHGGWDELSDSERDMVRDALRDVFRDCVREVESHAKGWGTVHSSVQAHLKKILSNEVDWRDVLHNFVGRAKSSERTSSIKRINRRYPWDHPGRKRSYTAHMAAAVDQSGSMHNSWIELLFAELGNLGNLTSFDVLPFDTHVNEQGIQHIRRGQHVDAIRTEQGGTDFNAPVDYVNQHLDAYDGLLILTDGQCFQPKRCERPVAYILAPGCDLMFETDAVVIKMTDTRKS